MLKRNLRGSLPPIAKSEEEHTAATPAFISEIIDRLLQFLNLRLHAVGVSGWEMGQDARIIDTVPEEGMVLSELQTKMNVSQKYRVPSKI